MVCYDFYKRSGVRCSPQGRNSGQKKRIDLTLRKTLKPHSSESGFHRNVKFATFEEAGRLCKTIPQNGVKVAPLGGRSIPKLPHWLSMVHGPSYTIETAFQLNITLDHSVIETRGRAHLTQTTNQHLRQPISGNSGNLFGNRKEYPSNHFARPISLHQNIV